MMQPIFVRLFSMKCVPGRATRVPGPPSDQGGEEAMECACATFMGCRNELHDALRRLTLARPAGHFIFLFVC